MSIKTNIRSVSLPYPVIGVEWNQSTDTWRHIDENGNTLNLSPTAFNNHPIWGKMRRCNMATTGIINAYKGEAGYAADGTNGRVMVEIPKCWVRAELPAANKYRWWFSANDRAGFEIHPAFRQSSGGAGAVRDFAYIGAYEADMVYDAANTHVELHSRTGKQPMTGEQIIEIAFDGGQNEPAIGDDVGTTTDDNWFIVDYVVTGGAWATNDAAGKLWIQKPGDDSCGWADNEDITNNTKSNTLAGGAGLGVNGAVSALGLTIGNARTYAQNIGTGWQQWNIWEIALVRLLYYIEYKGANSQSTSTGIGKGIVDKVSGTGFAGELTGADSIDTNVAANGTGTGTGTDGLTPIAYRGIENPWGNVWSFIDGYNAIDAAYQIAKKDGTSTLQDDMDDGQTPLSSSAAPITTDGYQSNILFEDKFKFLLFPTAVAGSSSTYLYDHLWAHDAEETNILFSGGSWHDGSDAGVGCLCSFHLASYSVRNIGTRLSFIGN